MAVNLTAGKVFTVNWIAQNATAIANGTTTFTQNVPINMFNSIPITNRFTGVTSYQYNMPQNTFRNIIMAGGPAATYTVVGMDKFGNIVTEIMNYTINTLYSANEYQTVYSITPTSANPGIMNIGFGPGEAIPFYADYWNKSNNYSIAFESMNGTNSLIPYYSLDKTPFNAASFYQFEIAQPTYTYSPTGLTIPITQNSIISSIGIPLTTISIVVPAISTGSFTLKILQEGAAY